MNADAESIAAKVNFTRWVKTKSAEKPTAALDYLRLSAVF
jgi:hypothetical protein